MGKICVGHGGLVVPDDWARGHGTAYLDWSEDYPGYTQPGEEPPAAEGDLPDLTDLPSQCADQACLDRWAANLLKSVWQTGPEPTDTQLQAVLAASRMLSNYGYPAWPTAVTDRGRNVGNWWGHHNWGAFVCVRPDGTPCSTPAGCSSGFRDVITRRDGELWIARPECFAHWPSNEEGARAMLTRITANFDASTLTILDSGDGYALAKMLAELGIVPDAKHGGDAAATANLLARHAKAIALARREPLYLVDRTPRGQVPVGYDPAPVVNQPPELTQRNKVLGILTGVAVGIGAGYAGVAAYRSWRRTA